MVSGVPMSNLIFLPHKHLWPTIKKLAKECRLVKKIAVPYIGKGGAASLHFRKGDILICALTEANARNGVVCPEEIEKLQAKGVKVYIRENLHAKIYLLGRTAIVCSANLSDNSANYLDEAGAMTTDRTVTPGINRWFKERMGQPVTPEWLAQCKDAYRPPSSERSLKNGAKNETRRESLWILAIEEGGYPENEEATRKLGYQIASKRLRRERGYEVQELRWPSTTQRFPADAKNGDLIIQIEDETGLVRPHGKLLYKKNVSGKSKTQVTYLFIEMPVRYRAMTWKTFQKKCDSFGLKLPDNLIAREVTNQSKKDHILALASPETRAVK